MKKMKLVTRRMKLSKKVVAIIMAFSLTFSAMSVSGTDKNNNIRENHAITNSEEKSLTEKQK